MLPRLKELHLIGHEYDMIPDDELFRLPVPAGTVGSPLSAASGMPAGTAGTPPSAASARTAGSPRSACKESVLPALEQLPLQPKQQETRDAAAICRQSVSPALARSPLQRKQQETCIAAAICAASRLTFLQMDNCKLRAVPVWVAQLTSLRSLSLAGNYLGAHETGTVKPRLMHMRQAYVFVKRMGFWGSKLHITTQTVFDKRMHSLSVWFSGGRTKSVYRGLTARGLGPEPARRPPMCVCL